MKSKSMKVENHFKLFALILLLIVCNVHQSFGQLYKIPFVPESDLPEPTNLKPQTYTYKNQNKSMVGPLADSLQEVLDFYLTDLGTSGVKGLSASLRIQNGDVWNGSSGISEEIPLVEVTPDHRFACGSITKLLLAATIMDMIEDGLMSLADSVSQYGINHPNIDASITIKQLLRHQSGLFSFDMNNNYFPYTQNNSSDTMSNNQTLSLFLDPPSGVQGGSFNYSNSNYVVLAMIIEQVTGNPFFMSVRDRLLVPAGAEKTFLAAYENWQGPIAHLWQDYLGQDGIIEDYHTFFTAWTSVLTSFGPAGGYFSTPGDLTLLLNTIFDGQILNSTSLLQMQETIATGLPASTKYGLGVMNRTFVVYINDTLSGIPTPISYNGWGHGGDFSYSAQAWHFPSKGVSIAAQCNDQSINSWELAEVIEGLLQVCARFEAVLSVDQVELDDDPLMYPNPASYFTELRCQGCESIAYMTVFDPMGRMIANVGNMSELNEIKSAQPGTYIIRINLNNDKTIFRRIVIN